MLVLTIAQTQLTCQAREERSADPSRHKLPEAMQQGSYAQRSPSSYGWAVVSQSCTQGRELLRQQLTGGLIACLWVLQHQQEAS